mmetsp:Transcript_20716/g.19758  ORF Transcript_20716/g.19758 Transcript_20716/m.19758 type:complete len:99 (-) Transcript_20716:145-441(-)
MIWFEHCSSISLENVLSLHLAVFPAPDFSVSFPHLAVITLPKMLDVADAEETGVLRLFGDGILELWIHLVFGQGRRDVREEIRFLPRIPLFFILQQLF